MDKEENYIITEVEFEETKNNLIIDLKLEIASIQEELNKEEIGTDNYNNILNRLNIANKELSILQYLTFKNHKVELIKMKNIKSNYGFLKSLSEDKIKEFLNILEEYQRAGFFELSKTIKIPEDITIEKASHDANVSINSSDDIKEIKNTINFLSEKKKKAEDILTKLKNSYDKVITTDFILLSTACRENRVVSNEILENLVESYPYIEHLKKRIREKKKRLNELKESVFRGKKFDETHESTMKLQNDLLNSITRYILYKLDNIKDETGKNVVIEAEDVFLKYTLIVEFFGDKIKDVKKLLYDLVNYYKNYNVLEERLISALNNLYPIKDRTDIDKIANLNRDDINSNIATINAYDKASRIIKEQDDEVKTLGKEKDGQKLSKLVS